MPGKVVSVVFLVLLVMSASVSVANVHVAGARSPGLFTNSAGAGSACVGLSYSPGFSNLTNYMGDLSVSGSQTMFISDCEFNISGHIVISDQAQVVLSNCVFVSNWNEIDASEKDPSPITLENQSRLSISDSVVMLLLPEAEAPDVAFHAIVANDETVITMNNSTLTWNGNATESGDSGVELNGYAKIVLTNSSVSTFQQPYAAGVGFEGDKDFIYAFEDSSLVASDSRIDRDNFAPQAPRIPPSDVVWIPLLFL